MARPCLACGAPADTLPDWPALCEACLDSAGDPVAPGEHIICWVDERCSGIVDRLEDGYVIVRTNDGKEAWLPQAEVVRAVAGMIAKEAARRGLASLVALLLTSTSRSTWANVGAAKAKIAAPGLPQGSSCTIPQGGGFRGGARGNGGNCYMGRHRGEVENTRG